MDLIDIRHENLSSIYLVHEANSDDVALDVRHEESSSYEQLIEAFFVWHMLVEDLSIVHGNFKNDNYKVNSNFKRSISNQNTKANPRIQRQY